MEKKSLFLQLTFSLAQIRQNSWILVHSRKLNRWLDTYLCLLIRTDVHKNTSTQWFALWNIWVFHSFIYSFICLLVNSFRSAELSSYVRVCLMLSSLNWVRFDKGWFGMVMLFQTYVFSFLTLPRVFLPSFGASHQFLNNQKVNLIVMATIKEAWDGSRVGIWVFSRH